MRLRRRALPVVTTCVMLWPAPAVAADRPSSHHLDVWAAAAQPYLIRPDRLFGGGVAYSGVHLAPGSCRATGAGYWLDDMEDRGVIGSGPAPRHPMLGFDNVTASRTYRPPPDPRWGDYDLEPVLPTWTSSCEAGNRHGTATAYDGAAETSAVSEVDARTGKAVSVARSWIAAVPAAPDLTGLRSLLQVVHEPGGNARVTYRLMITRAGGHTWAVEGTGVSLTDLGRQFAGQLAANSAAVSRLASLGLRLAEPVVERRWKGHAKVTAPALCTDVGLLNSTEVQAPPRGTHGVCFGITAYDGTLTAPAG